MRKRIVCCTVALLLSGCTVGPDYEPVAPALPAQFVEAPGLPGSAPDSLWQAFDEPELSALIVAARTNNARIEQALATLNESRALSGLRIYSLFPTVGVGGEAERLRESGSDPFGMGTDIVERYRAGFDVTWEIDLFGSLRRSAEAIIRQTEADLAALYAVEISIVAETAQTYFQWRSAVLREALLSRNVAAQAANVEILERALDAGRGTALDVARARSLERSLAASLPAARVDVAAAEQRLAVLTGQSVVDLRTQLAAPVAMPPMPRLVAAGTPEDWLARRPDIRAAERRLAQAISVIGVETAEFYPKLDLIGDFGWTAGEAGDLGDSSAERWRFAPTLSWRILDFGRVRQRVLAAEAQAAGALATFEQTWRTAIEETEVALANYQATSETVAILTEAQRASAEALRLATLRYDNGADSFLAVLDAERTDLDLQDQRVLALRDQATALAALYKALGGSFTEPAAALR